MVVRQRTRSIQQLRRCHAEQLHLLVDTMTRLTGPARGGSRQAASPTGARIGRHPLDSGDLAYLSIEARRILDAAGFGMR